MYVCVYIYVCVYKACEDYLVHKRLGTQIQFFPISSVRYLFPIFSLYGNKAIKDMLCLLP